MLKIKGILVLGLFILLVYTRFINLTWGFPYPMHPDERNMANTVQGLNCEISNFKFQISNCFNPHFFAYGQFPLYTGYMVVLGMKFFAGDLGTPISFEEAALSLRIISAVSSILNVFVALKILALLLAGLKSKIKDQKSKLQIKNQKGQAVQLTNSKLLISGVILIFSPFFIQFSHFGTTESLLMLLYSLIVYVCLLCIHNKILNFRFLLLTSFLTGLAVATKISSVLFLILPVLLLLKKDTIVVRPSSYWLSIFYNVIKLIIMTFVISLIFSPHNFISFSEFLGSMKYESDVALGIYRAFYTRQFEGTIPILFQLEKIFPYTLGWPAFIFSLLGFIFLPWKKEINFLRFAILAQFIQSAFMYAKWTRFVSPILPLMLVLAILFLFVILNLLAHRSFSEGGFQDLLLKIRFRSKFAMTGLVKFALCILIFTFIVPGIAFLSIYQNADTRFTASEWIYKNIPENSLILSETANVVDLPITTTHYNLPTKNYQYISFDFYHLDENAELQQQFEQFVNTADYIFVPSRRVFANHYCNIKDQRSKIKNTNQKSKMFVILNSFQNLISKDLTKCEYLQKSYPLLHEYYQKFFSRQLGYEKVAEFTSYPKIELFGKTLIELPDEEAEETWTVFDHPVFRIYKRLSQKS